MFESIISSLPLDSFFPWFIPITPLCTVNSRIKAMLQCDAEPLSLFVTKTWNRPGFLLSKQVVGPSEHRGESRNGFNLGPSWSMFFYYYHSLGNLQNLTRVYVAYDCGSWELQEHGAHICLASVEGLPHHNMVKDITWWTERVWQLLFLLNPNIIMGAPLMISLSLNYFSNASPPNAINIWPL